MMQPLVRFLTLMLAGCATAFAEQAWEVLGDVVAIRSGDPEVAVLRLADGATIEVPLDALTEASRNAARRAAASTPPVADGEDGDPAIFVPGPFGRPVRISVPETIKDIETDAIQCRSAAEAADVYRLALAGSHLVPAQRAAAEARLREWSALADEGRVRCGDRWVSGEEAQAAAAEAEKLVQHGLELMRLGNADLAEEELRKASRVDPEHGRASFVMGLSYALVARNSGKAAEHFADVVRRDPGNAAALNNLAVLELLTRRHASAAGHLGEAVEAAADPSVVVDNVAWAVKLAGDAKAIPSLATYKMPGKVVDDLNGLYRTLIQELKVKPAANVAGPRYLGPDGVACSVTTLGEVVKLFDADGSRGGDRRRALGFVVAPEYVVCPRGVVVATDGDVVDTVTISLPKNQTRHLDAVVVDSPDEGDVALIRCKGLSLTPLSLAEVPLPQAEVIVVDRSAETWLDVRARATSGKVVTPVSPIEMRARFVHTAVVPRGLGGGPIVDEQGRVVGMVASSPRTHSSGNVAGFGISVEKIRSLLDEFPEDAPGGAQVGGVQAAAAIATAGVVFVNSQTRAGRSPAP